eukprot:scaffold42983_cov176-Amphora_coffeaeformis.AAC.3
MSRGLTVDKMLCPPSRASSSRVIRERGIYQREMINGTTREGEQIRGAHQEDIRLVLFTDITFLKDV